ncbi:GvpL/GvpF family gas vesicle protein [Streptomyces sp. NPDC049577]|uniref:GvpL/GvpF family gas vesicle protein n=1 Tax=Streptomyces sp. NPDC049577 TaxID=3155153 RepID=UPI0034298CD5
MSTYVYGIARAGRPASRKPLRGIGDPPHPVRTVEADGLAALVSDCPDQLRAKRRDLLAHQSVLAEAGADGPVLPLRFGSLSESDDAVRAVLTERAGHYRQRLEALDGRVEYNVKAAHREEAVLRQVLEEEPAVRTLNESCRAAGGGSYQERLRLGEMVAQAVRAREVSDARAVRDALRPHAEAEQDGPGGDKRLLDVSFLVARERAEAFLAAARSVESGHARLELTVTGPLPPYSFVE